MGDTPSSSFHTQTLTQLLSRNKDEQEDWLTLIRDSDEEDDDGWDMELPEIRRAESSTNTRAQVTSSRSTSIIPQTPSHRGSAVDLTEVSSTQSSHLSPAPRNSFISPIRSPLKDKSSNVNAPTPTLKSIMKRPRNFVVQDSFSSVNGSSASAHGQSPVKPVTPARLGRWPEAPRTSVELGESISKAVVYTHDVPLQTPTRNSRHVCVEIPDSDAELESVGPSPEKADIMPGTPAGMSSNKENETPETRAPLREIDPGHGGELSDEETASEGPGTPTPLARKVKIHLPSQHPDEEAEEVPVTPLPKSTTTPKTGRRETQARSQFTQALESQRLPLEVIRDMGPQTDRSDVILSIHPGPVEDIVNGTKNHEFRNYKIPGQVSRIWIYVTQPICELRYMAIIGPGKQPGEIDDETSLGNAEFNAGTSGYKFAHELLQVYQLNNAVPLSTMKENGWVGNPPQKYVYVPPAVVGQLLANLRCALFDVGNEPDLSISQEVEEQLRSDILYSTQLVSDGHDGHDVVIPSSQEPSPDDGRPTTAKANEVFAKPPLPTRAQSEVVHKTPTKRGPITRPSQATTASEPSSPVHSPDKSLQFTTATRPELPSSHGESLFPEYNEERSPPKQLQDGGPPFSLGSSQPMLPDSLFVDDVRQPPVILDSDDEGSDG